MSASTTQEERLSGTQVVTQTAEILVREVRKSFGETTALDGCSLSVKLGEVHAIVGENGSGKSTLVKILSGVIKPDSGLISAFGSTPRNPRHAI